MKTIQVAISIVALVLVLSAWSEQERSGETTAVQVKALHDYHFRAFSAEVDTLAFYTQQAKSVELAQLQTQIMETRYAYKRIEFLFDYVHTKYTYFNINGGPLYKIDDDQPELPPVRPNGLQALDELIFSDEADTERRHIDSLAQELQNAVHFIGQTHFMYDYEDHKTIESIRSGLIRVFTLGVTGFDTPGSGNAMKEAEVSLKVMQETFQLFEKNVLPPAQEKFQEIIQLFDKGITQVNTQNFDNFDRMAFLREVINPLYKELWNFVRLQEINPNRFKHHAHNYETDNLFDSDFLNRDFFQEFSYLPLDNPKSIELGRLLFFDPVLSKDQKMSCASCHSPDKAFADGLPTSQTNIEGKFTLRNAPTLIDAGFSKRFFHDLRTANLERQVPHVIENQEEFNISFWEITQRLNQSQTYLDLFKSAYEGISYKGDINQRSISNALAAYVNSLVSFNSEFDKYVREETDIYSAEAIRGFNLFMGKAACATCHFPPAFNGTVPPFYAESESEVLGVTIGLDSINPQMDQDLGRYGNGMFWEKRPHFKHSFKTVGLRNVALTAPYMHNGTFNNLEEVMDFYNLGGGAGMGLDIENQTLAPDPLNLTKNEVGDLITFLHTLTDTSGLHPGIIDLPKFENQPEWNKRKAVIDY